MSREEKRVGWSGRETGGANRHGLALPAISEAVAARGELGGCFVHVLSDYWNEIRYVGLTF